MNSPKPDSDAVAAMHNALDRGANKKSFVMLIVVNEQRDEQQLTMHLLNASSLDAHAVCATAAMHFQAAAEAEAVQMIAAEALIPAPRSLQ